MSGGDPAGDRQWVLEADRYVATLGFVPDAGPFNGALTCRSLLRDGVELLAGPGAPLVLAWMGRLPSTTFEVAGERVELTDGSGCTLDEAGRPLHGLGVASRCWDVVQADAAALTASAEPDFGPHFPAPFGVSVAASVGERGLTLRTTLEATTAVTAPAALGWHPYLRAPGTVSGAAGVEVFVPFTVACELDDLLPTGVERTVAPGWVRDPVLDHHWRASPGESAVVRSGEFEVRLTFGEGYGWAMTWVPDVGAGFVCVEPMAGPLDPFRLGSGVPEATPGRPWVGEFVIG